MADPRRGSASRKSPFRVVEDVDGTPVTREKERRDLASALDAFQEYLKQKDLKLTGQRTAIVRKVFSTHRHFTAEELQDLLKSEKGRISKATVYRTLALLTECDLIVEHDFGQGQKYYEQILGRVQHDHLICVSCGKIDEFTFDPIAEVQDRIARAKGFRPISHALHIFGMCEKCASKRST
jgi:Fur family transcriptional regulator, ferric uptake regulator